MNTENPYVSRKVDNGMQTWHIDKSEEEFMTSEIFRCQLEGRERRKQLTFIRSRRSWRTQGGNCMG